ncbi:chondroitin AC/alginate lyase [Annulohypoxylon maeteangense]|uniref:chondroitin AC/alginate lyase n=1 Tax=Annulohypoxylon maeteangense TaxID=1927788 RepID=UPI0020082B97|nr:chondroitin AC/alginate lyase [Annulohypoxylon maeteangense]KAI0888035.1 chondroitin AC/alginate lyase [Annulohypoxylon maeteangense]
MLKVLLSACLASSAVAFVHPGLLHTTKDLTRVKEYVNKAEEPWNTTYKLLSSNSLAQSTYTPNAQQVIYRGSDGTHAQNYPTLYKDVHAAYQLAIRWHVEGVEDYANASINILNAWATTLESIGGDSNGFLAAGIYGYQIANAAELMRDYSGWNATSQDKLKTMLVNVFYPLNYRFLTTHNGQDEYHYWANWDFCNLAAMMAIGVYTDNQTMYNWGRDYFLHGDGRGAINNFIYANFTEEGTGKRLAQGQEAGRDQGHATLDLALLGVIMQQGYNQGEDLFAEMDNSGLAAAEYVAKYNTGHDVPYTWYNSYLGNQTVISENSRYTHRPGFELLYAHYAGVKGLDASWTKLYRDEVNGNSTDKVEGGGSNYGGNSGGYDDLGFGTLLYRLTA